MSATLDLPLQLRQLNVIADGVDVEKRTVKLSFSSETPILREFGFETLSHENGSMVTERLNKKAVPFLLNHDWTRSVGKIVSYSVEGGRGIATVKMSRSALGQETFDNITDEISTEVSVGYVIHEMKKTGTRASGEDEYLINKWEPIEISLVGVPADYTVGIGRSAEDKTYVAQLSAPEEVEASPEVVTRVQQQIFMADPIVTEPKVEIVKEDIGKIRELEHARIREITAIGGRFDAGDDANEYIRSGKTVADFNAHILNNKINSSAPVIRVMDPTVGMSVREMNRYSLTKAILEGAEGLSGFEKEVSQEIGRRVNRKPTGFFVPDFAFRDLSATGGATLGGDLIETQVSSSLIPMLRNKLVVGRAGATMMGGLVGNVALPRQTGTATATWNSEIQDPTRTAAAFDQVSLNPQRLAAVSAYSKQLLAQSSLDVQSIVRDDLLAVIARAQDAAALFGTGINNQPTGVFPTPADTVYPSNLNKTSPSVTFGSGYPSWTQVLAFEGNVANNNIDLDDSSCAYITSPSVKTFWKGIAKSDPRATNPMYPSFIWEDGDIVNGYKAFATATITSNKVVFGKWSDLIIATWADWTF